MKLKIHLTPLTLFFGSLISLVASPMVSFQELDKIPAVVEKGPLSYPSDLKREPRAGFANLWITVRENGTVAKVRTLEATHPFFADVAANAALKTIFEAPLHQGQPVSSEFLVGYAIPRNTRLNNDQTYAVKPRQNLDGEFRNAQGRPIPLIQFSAFSETERAGVLFAKNPFFDFPESIKEGPLQYDEAPEVVKFYPPIFPTSRILSGKSNETVQVSWLIAPNGVPFQPVAAPGTDPEYAKAAVAAIRYWRFTPGKLNGEPVMAGLAYPFKFNRFRMVDSALKSTAQRIKNKKLVPVSPSALDNPLDLRVFEDIRFPLVEEKAKGFAEIKAYINEEGQVILPEIVNTNNEDLAWSAATAMAQWRFSPPTVNGKPTHVVFKQRFEN